MAWNSRQEPALQTRKSATRHALLGSAARAAASSIAFFAARTSFWDQSNLLSSRMQLGTGVLGYLVASVLLLSCLSHLYTAASSRRQPEWEKKLTDKQRRLFGLPTPQKPPPHSQAAPAATEKKSIGPPLGPPIRHAKPFTPLRSTFESFQADTPTSPLTPCSGGSRKRPASPYQTTPTITTPEQLQYYLDMFEEQTQTTTPSPRGFQQEGSPAAGQFGSRPTFFQPFGASEQPSHQYRPSLQARGKAGSPLRADILTPSSQETFEAVLARLSTNPRSLEVWVDRFREWLADEVVNPLASKLRTAHKEVASSARQLTWTIELTSLAQPEASASNKGLEADEEAQINMLKEALSTQLRNPMQEQQRTAVLACLQAVHQYQRLTALLRGDYPKGLLPPTPRGYVASRVQELADGPCLASFTWNAGGTWQNKPWTADMLTDSALVLYLFAAFLEAPKWTFPLEESRQSAIGAPLYLGSLPSRPAQHCTAVLPVRPTSLPKGATAILALGLATREPTITLALRGEPALTLCSYTAVFVQLLLLVQSCKLDNFGGIGKNSLQYLKLDKVVRPVDALSAALRTKWFGLW